MACNKHKQREHGAVVPVLNGLAKDVVAKTRRLDNISSVGFRFVCGYKGKQKVKIDDSRAGELHITVCDNEFGKGIMVVKTPDVAAAARHLSSCLSKDGITVA